MKRTLDKSNDEHSLYFKDARLVKIQETTLFRWFLVEVPPVRSLPLWDRAASS